MQKIEQISSVNLYPFFPVSIMEQIPASSINIPDKKRNPPRRTLQLSGRSQGVGQFSLYQCKGMPNTAALHIFRRQNALKKIGHEQSGGQILKSQKISVFKMLSSWITSSNGNRLSTSNCTHHLLFANSIFKFIIHDC